MSQRDLLSDFVRQGLSSGRTSEELHDALIDAGWSQAEVDQSLRGWAVAADMPPVPRPRPYVSAREAMLFGLLFVALGAVAANIVVLGFDMINLAFDDPTETRRAGGVSRWSIAVLIAFLPLFLVLNRVLNRRSADDQARRRSLVRKWIASVTMLIAVICLLCDLVATIYALLTGELSFRFAAKAALVAVIGGLVLVYYRGELDV